MKIRCAKCRRIIDTDREAMECRPFKENIGGKMVTVNAGHWPVVQELKRDATDSQ